MEQAPVRLGQGAGQGVERAGGQVVVVVVLDGLQRLAGGAHRVRPGVRQLGDEVQAALRPDRGADGWLVDADQVRASVPRSARG